jgi:hypothetical protein
MTRINDVEKATMYTRVTKDQFEIRDGVYIHRPTEAEFAPNPNSEGSMLIYTGNIGSRLASGELFAYADLLRVMKVLWKEISRDGATVAEAILAE